MRSEDLSYFEDPEFKDALAKYEESQRKGNALYMDADELTDIAEYYAMQGREKEATACANFALNLHPGAVDPQVFLARQAMFAGDIRKANLIADLISEQQDREVIFLRAELLLREEKDEECEELLQQYLRSLEYDQDMFIYDTANVYLDYDCHQLAEKWIKLLKKNYPNYPSADKQLADLYTCSGRCQEAISILNRLLDENSFDGDLWIILTEAQCGLGKFEEGLDSIDYALALHPHDPHAMCIRAHCLFHLMRTQEAHEQYKIYLQIAPRDLNALMMDSICLIDMSQFQKALKQFLSIKNKEPETMEAACMPYIALCYEALGMTKEFIESYTKALILNPEVTNQLIPVDKQKE